MTGQRIVLKGKTLDEIAARVRSDHGPRARIVAAERVTSGGLGIAGLFSKRYVEATVELPERGRRAAGPRRSSGRRASDRPRPERAFTPTPAQRVGLAALLADAEDAEEGFATSRAGPRRSERTRRCRSPASPPGPRSRRGRGVRRPHGRPRLQRRRTRRSGAERPAWPAPSDPPLAVPSGPRRPAAASAAAPAAGPASRPSLLEGPGDLVVVVGERPDTSATVQAMAEGSTPTRAAMRVAGTCADGRFVAV